MTSRIFERAAAHYEAWYATCRGLRADAAERGLLLRLLGGFPDARSAIEIGCGTGHFAEFLVKHGLSVIGLDRAPAMLTEAQRLFPSIPVVLGDAHRLPFRDASADLAVFVTTLEFLEDAARALSEAVRVARQGVVAVVLNRYSPGGLSRRFGPQSRGSLLGLARDYSLSGLRRELTKAAGSRLGTLNWSSSLFPDGLWNHVAHVPVGDVIGIMAELKTFAKNREPGVQRNPQSARLAFPAPEKL